MKRDSILDKQPVETVGQLRKAMTKIVKLKRDLHPVIFSVKSRKRKREAFEALHRMENVELDRKDGLLSPAKPQTEAASN